MWGDYLFKLIYDTRDEVRGIELGIFQLSNMKNIKTQHISHKITQTIARLGNDNRTIDLFPEGKKKRKVDVGKNASPFVLVDSLDGNNLVLMLGSNFEPSSPVPIMFPGAVGLIAASAMLIATATLQEVSWGSSNQLYTYLSGDLKSDFTKIDLKRFSPGIIDRFEIAMDDADQKFAYKGYARFNNKTYCFYQPKKSKFVRIMTSLQH